MTRHVLGRILHFAYPTIVFAIGFLILSSANLAEVARYTPPPVSGGFSFYWNPIVSDAQACTSKQDSKIKFKQACSATGSRSALEQFGSRSAKVINRAN